MTGLPVQEVAIRTIGRRITEVEAETDAAYHRLRHGDEVAGVLADVATVEVRLDAGVEALCGEEISLAGIDVVL